MSIPLKQGRRFCFTLWDDFCFKQNIFSTEVKYCVIGAEKSSSTLRDHYQGFISFTNVKRPGAVKDFLGSQTVHLTNATGSDLQNKVYCSKEGYVIFELGEPVAPGQHKRKRIQLCEEDPESAKIEDPNMYNRYICLQKRKAFIENYADVHPRHPWQNILMEYISGSPDHRSIYWIYGPDGGEGKTEFSKLLEAKYNYFVVKPTKIENMMYYYIDDNTTRHVCVDIPRRVQQSHYDAIYDFIESVKDRMIQSTKYRPVKYRELNLVHCIVMSNQLPDYEKISSDRVILIECNPLS